MLLTVGDQQSVDQLTSFFHVATWDISCSVIMPIRLPAICDYHQTRSPLEKGLHVWGLSHMDFHTAATNCASSRHSILRLWRGPSPRAYARGIILHGLLYHCGELCLFEALHPAPLARPFSKGLLEGDYLTWTFIPLQRIVPLRGTPSCAFGAALLQGPTRGRNILVPSHSFFISFSDGVK